MFIFFVPMPYRNSSFSGLLLEPKKTQGAGEEMRPRVEEGLRRYSSVAGAQDPEVLFHGSVLLAHVEKEEEEEEKINL